MPNVYSITMKIAATAYVVADTSLEAEAIAKRYKDASLEVHEDLDADVPITGMTYSSRLPEFSLSPAMTLIGPYTPVEVEFVEKLKKEDRDV